MAEALTTQEEVAVEEFLAALRCREHSAVSQITAVKFLMARKFDVSRAMELFQAYKNTRIKEGIFNINPNEEPLRTELLSGKFTVLPGRDANGAALALFTARLHWPDVSTHRTVLQAIIYQLDQAIESLQTQRDGLVFIYDMSDSTYANFDYELCVKILDLLKGAFPARLKCVFVVSSPLWFRAPFAVLRLFVREKLRERVCTVKARELANHVPVSSIPTHLGGTSQSSHTAWLRSCANSTLTSSVGASADCFGGLLHPSGPNHRLTAVSSDAGDAHRQAHHYWNGGANVPNGHRPPPPQSDTPPDTPLHHDPDADQRVGVPPLPQKTARPTPLSRSPVQESAGHESVHTDEPGGMSIHELAQHVKSQKKKGIYQEYEEIRKEPPTGSFDYSKKPANQVKNRYSDVLCMDHSRVRLGPLQDEDEDETSDYINASFMDGYKTADAYIATQGPLPKTFGDFWRMVWERMVLIVVMTTRVVERGRVKCGQYWPLEAGRTEEYGFFLVKNVHVAAFRDFNLSHLELYNSRTGECREVFHYLYLSWPDFGVPKSASAMLDFRAEVRQRQELGLQALYPDGTGPTGGPPMVVHCSAGIGRTGTFCTLDICLARLEDAGAVDVKQTVRRMRGQRAFSIQTWDQYYFCYRAILEYAQRTGRLPSAQWSEPDTDSDTE